MYTCSHFQIMCSSSVSSKGSAFIQCIFIESACILVITSQALAWPGKKIALNITSRDELGGPTGSLVHMKHISHKRYMIVYNYNNITHVCMSRDIFLPLTICIQGWS